VRSLSRLPGSIVRLRANDLSYSAGAYRPRLGRGVFTRSFINHKESSMSSIRGLRDVKSNSYPWGLYTGGLGIGASSCLLQRGTVSSSFRDLTISCKTFYYYP